ncbi:MAG: hypothetical protein HC812_08225 [Leptolyngbya sp. RL_3_1]|nr:hypothetical protein [Leptolyngbya sp. RL_3_1]
MTLPGSNRDLEQACLLLQEYSFDLGGYTPPALMDLWQRTLEVDPTWIRTAVLEALYQGRYKAFSVEQILLMWKRRGQPVRHFNHDFERVAFGPLDPHASSTALIAATLVAPPVTPSPPPADRPTNRAQPHLPLRRQQRLRLLQSRRPHPSSRSMPSALPQKWIAAQHLPRSPIQGLLICRLPLPPVPIFRAPF